MSGLEALADAACGQSEPESLSVMASDARPSGRTKERASVDVRDVLEEADAAMIHDARDVAREALRRALQWMHRVRAVGDSAPHWTKTRARAVIAPRSRNRFG